MCIYRGNIVDNNNNLSLDTFNTAYNSNGSNGSRMSIPNPQYTLSSSGSNLLLYFYSDLGLHGKGFELAYWYVIVITTFCNSNNPFHLYSHEGWTTSVQTFARGVVCVIIARAHAHVTQVGLGMLVTLLRALINAQEMAAVTYS